MKEIKSSQPKSSFAKDVLKMASAPLCTQILGVILMPIITRLYIPDSYGTFQLFASIVTPIVAFVSLGYNDSIILPKKDEVASNLLCISLMFTATITLLTVFFIWFGSSSGVILKWLKAPELESYLWLIPVTVFVSGLYLSFSSWNVRNRRFSRIAASRISNAVVNKTVLIGAGFSGFATSGSLIVGRITGLMAASFILGLRIWKENALLFKRSIRWANIAQGMKRYRKFPMYNLWINLIGRLTTTVVIFLLSFYFSKTVIGYYGLGLVVLTLPTTFIAGSIGEVFYQRGARARDDGTNALLVERLFKQMARLGILLFLVLGIAGEDIFSFVFGANWAEAGVYAQILSFKMFVNFIATPAKILTNILEKQEVMLILQFVAIVISGASIIIGGLVSNIYLALVLFSLSNGIAFLGLSLYMFRLEGVSVPKTLVVLLKCFVSCAPVAIAIVLAKLCFSDFPLILIVTTVIGCAIYYGLLLKNDTVLQSTIIAVFKKEKPAQNI